MPTDFGYDGFRFFFQSNEGDPCEPVHVELMKAGAEAETWLDPVSVARASGFDAEAAGRRCGRAGR